MPTLAGILANHVRQLGLWEALDRKHIRCHFRAHRCPFPEQQTEVCNVPVNRGSALYALVVLLAPSLWSLAIPSPAGAGRLHHYEYVFPDSSIDVYDMDNQGALVKHVRVRTSAGVRGTVASAVTGMLYISFGSDRGRGGSMLKYNLMTDQVV
jgi:hypothetical protein